MKRWILLISVMQWTAAGFCAGTTAANFLKCGVGARNVAMGETGATEKSADSAYWNPAGLAVLSAPAASFMHAQWFEDVTFEYLSFVRPFSFGTLGISANYLTMGDIEKFDNTGTKMNQAFRPSDMAAVVSCARLLGNIPCGVNLKYIHSAIDDATADAYALDAGLLFDHYAPENMSVGLSVQNVGTGMKFARESYALPLNVRMGLSWRATPRLTIAADANKASDTDISGNAGVEYLLPVGKAVSLAPRAGYKTNVRGIDGMAGLAAGFGITVNAITFDYALMSYGSIDNAHRISLSYRFAPVENKIQRKTVSDYHEPDDNPGGPQNPPHMPADGGTDEY